MKWRKELGTQIQQARAACGLSQGDLAKKMGVSRQMVGRYEAGRAVASINVLARAADALGTKFRILEFEVSFETPERAPAKKSEQLRLDFNKVHVFPGSEVRILPKKGRIVIRTAVPA